ncbi:MAG: DUF2249 domain-containing protein [Pseudomonadales bacterium]|jgi:hypothetical protein|nr:DUF2249 domain-containing protein [Pseudomonadales bacterium]MDP6472180.1 DUF2249 domain-containing protein [Pseudomonadales bacterium]MDP6826568.1 DUF2249 domain-containing protein [Pseudomonadales bacterium]MDP6970161.1 DUF2249 domain-containing protein [Pseudomonadales bacterium]|tara:strand:+ start:5520 stop:5777 length:258 start_codon:yes stop_codon:yes gene_type:complete
MPVEITLDASAMEPPEPFDRATEILRQLAPGHYLRMLHRRVPHPLFDFCREMSLSHCVIGGEASAYEIIIYYPADEPALRQEGVL